MYPDITLYLPNKLYRKLTRRKISLRWKMNVKLFKVGGQMDK